MSNCAIGEKTTSSLQVLNNSLVCFFDVDTLVWFDDGGELSVLIDRHGGLARLDDSSSDTCCVIILSEAGSAVDYSSTGVLGDPGSSEHLEATVFPTAFEEFEEWFVALADECLSLELLKDLVALNLALLDDIVETIFHADVDLFSRGVLPPDVVKGGVDSQGQVRGKGPRRGSPSHEMSLLSVLKNWEGDDDGGIRDILVIGTSFEVGEHGVAGGGEGHDLGATVDELLVEDLLEGPPDTLHVVAIHGLVVVLEIDPATEPAHRLLPLLGVAHDDLAAKLVVATHAELFSVDGRLDLVDLVNFKLDGETVAIPAEFTLNVVSLHGGVASDNILHRRNKQNEYLCREQKNKQRADLGSSTYLDSTGSNMAVVRESGGEGGAIVEGELWLALRQLELLLERADFIPVLQYFLFLSREVGLVRN